MELVWHRNDLRVHDHPALNAAVAGGPCLGLVIIEPRERNYLSIRRQAWFHLNVRELSRAYRDRGGTLIIKSGYPWEVLPALATQTSATAVRALKRYSPDGQVWDKKTEMSLRIPIFWHAGNYLYEPGTVVKNDSTSYVIFSPYARRAKKFPWPDPLPSPEVIPGPQTTALGEIPDEPIDCSLPEAGEGPALKLLDSFLINGVENYHKTRNALDGRGTSHLSPYFTLGVLSPRLAASVVTKLSGPGSEKWLAELFWRDFCADLLLNYPQLHILPFDRRWLKFPWRHDLQKFEAWKSGRTGVPVVDAAMRELRTNGWISNRARMLAAQFLVKYLFVPWQWGERYFRNCLIDGDLASNVVGWQWAGGLGVDAVPYFRVFNFESQIMQHDPEGSWLRRWSPEYPENPNGSEPIVDLARMRLQYLEIAQVIKRHPSATTSKKMD